MKLGKFFITATCISFLVACKPKVSTHIVYTSEMLQIEQITPRIFRHISYLKTNDFGNVACNGMIFINGTEALVFDTPTTNKVSQELIHWVQKEKNTTIKGIIVNHFHEDCLGGLEAFHQYNIPSYANNTTIELAKKNKSAIPQIGFENELKLRLGGEEAVTLFLGEGHTKDNTVSYVKSEKTLFGGCLVKGLKAKKGYLGDANIVAWPLTMAKVKTTFPEVKIVIPGHGKSGNADLLEYTQQLFQD